MANALPGQIIGYRKNGTPIRLIAGGSEAATEAPPVQEESEQKTGTTRFYSQEEFNAERERVRQEERDKLYPQLSKSSEQTKAMQDELRELRAFQKKQEKAEADRLKAIEAERKKREEAEMSAKELIAKRDAEFAARLEQIERENALRVAAMEKEIEFNKLAAYTQRRVSEESDSIAPELIDFIGGNSVEEVEASIERVKAKTAQIMEGIQQAGIARRAQMPGVAPAAGTNGVTPMDQPADRQLSAEDIKGMSMKEFAQLRDRIGMGNANNQGLFR